MALDSILFPCSIISKEGKCGGRSEFRRRTDEPLGRNQSSLDGTDHQILHELRRLPRLPPVFHLGSDVAIVRTFTTRLFRLVLDSIDCLREHARGLREILRKHRSSTVTIVTVTPRHLLVAKQFTVAKGGSRSDRSNDISLVVSERENHWPVEFRK